MNDFYEKIPIYPNERSGKPKSLPLPYPPEGDM